jgi:3-methylfumaryl-CoA hydratase
VRGRIGPGPVVAFAALLDVLAPSHVTGDPLPPLWHWFSFLDHPPQSALGADGHPAAGHFLPPIPDCRRMIARGRVRQAATLRVGDLTSSPAGPAWNGWR